MALNEPIQDQRLRSKSQPNALSIAKDFGKAPKTDNINTKSTNQDQPEISLSVPSILVEGEVLEIDPDVPEMHRVARSGDLERLKELIEAGESVNVQDTEGWPPLHTAIKSGNYDCAQLLIKNGATDFFERQQEEYRTRLNLSSRISKGRLYSF